MINEKRMFPDPLEEIKPTIDLFPRKISYDYEDLEREREKEKTFQTSTLYNPVQVQNFEQWNKDKHSAKYLMEPTDFFDMYKGVMTNRKMSGNSTDSSNVIDTLF